MEPIVMVIFYHRSEIGEVQMEYQLRNSEKYGVYTFNAYLCKKKHENIIP